MRSNLLATTTNSNLPITSTLQGSNQASTEHTHNKSSSEAYSGGLGSS